MPPTNRVVPVKNLVVTLRKCEICKKLLHDRPSYKAHMKAHSDGRPYACDICPYKCRVKKYLSRHKRKVHTEANGPECPVCGKVFHFNSSLRNHLRVHTGERPFICNVCKKTFSSTYCLSVHKLIHTDQKPFECKFCDYACRDSSTLRKHEERHMGIYRTFPCDKCKRTFKSRRTLQMHIDEVHYGVDTRQIPCEICDKMFRSNSAVRMHIKTVHERSDRIQCEICDRYISKNNMGVHLKSHVDIRPFKCDFKNCGKTFKNKSAIQKHSVIHYPDRHYQCEFCDSKFTRKIRLKRHKLQHVSNGYTCDHCGGSFSTKYYLRMHLAKKHGKKCERYVCDECGSIHFSKRSIIVHFRYGHGNRYERHCRICGDVLRNNSFLTEHYLTAHKVKYVVKNEQEVTIKKEREEVDMADHFDFNYDVQKIEVEEHVPNLEDPSKSTTFTKTVLEVDLSKSIINADVSERTFDDFYRRALNTSKSTEYIPEYADIETTLAYSEKVLEEDISRSVAERHKLTSVDVFDDYFLSHGEDILMKGMTQGKVDKTKLGKIQKTVDKLLNESRARKSVDVLEKMRQEYNRRIHMACRSKEKKETSQIKYYQKPKDISDNNSKCNDNDDKDNDRSEHVDNITQDDKESSPRHDKGDDCNDSTQNNDIATDIDETSVTESNDIDESSPRPDKGNDCNDSTQNNDIATGIDETNVTESNDIDESSPRHDKGDECNDSPQNNDITTDIDEPNVTDGNDVDDIHIDDESRPKRAKRTKTVMEDDDYDISDDTNKNGKLTFDGHECYICFKVFKTKNDLKLHSREHFDICNDKMLKKCPFCDYVTNLSIKKHVEMVHKFKMKYPYAQITEKKNTNGSKYVFEIAKDCELEIIPSISNLNKMACMKIDETNRKNNNLFVGKTKLVKKGSEWVVVKEAVGITVDNILPDFTEDDYNKLKITGTSYCDRLKQLSVMAKSRGVKMLFPCEGCEKICQTLSALKLHNRKHELNPKQFKPKVWVNRHIEYKTKNRKKDNRRRNNKNKKGKKEKSVHQSVKVSNKRQKEMDIRVLEHRYAPPQPVKNNHKCDKKLIEFYQSNIRGGDIEFWQFLKIFNKMNRENVNDFEDLVNRDDMHFGIHDKDEGFTPVNVLNKPVTNRNESVTKSTGSNNRNKQIVNRKMTAPVVNTNEEISDENEVEFVNEIITTKKPIMKKKINKIKTINEKQPRVIIISKKENMRRNEIKKQMRQRLTEISHKV